MSLSGGGASRPRGHRPGPARWLLAGFLAVPVVEIAVAIAVARAIGVGWTLAALAVLSVAGVVTLLRAGRAAVTLLGPPVVADGRTPAAGTASRARGADLALEAAGGVLLTVPGFVTGVLGLLLVLPTRAVLRPLLGLTATRLVRSAARRGRWRVVAGEAVDVRVVEVRDLDDRPDR